MSDILKIEDLVIQYDTDSGSAVRFSIAGKTF